MVNTEEDQDLVRRNKVQNDHEYLVRWLDSNKVQYGYTNHER